MKELQRMMILVGVCLLLACPVCLAGEWLEADGLGYASEASMEEDLEYQQMTAYQAAKLEACAALVERMDGIKVDANSTVLNHRLQSHQVEARVSGVLKGVEVIKEEYHGRSCRVRVRVPLYGAQSLAAAVLPEQGARQPIPQAAGGVMPFGGCTGVIIDCRGLGLQRAMSPVIKSVNGLKIYGYTNLDRDFVIRNGMASYTDDPEGWHERAGNNPLTFKAVALDGNGVNPVLAEQDANRLLAENSVTHFLENCQVVLVE